MKKLFFCAFLCSLMYSSLHAQTSPRLISYQGLLRPAGSTTGSQIAGNRLLTVTLYGDADGTIKLWHSTINTLIDSSGVFNCILGTPDNPLPEATTMDRPIWVGIAVGSSAEMRPLAQFTASPYALNVADSSITSSKLNMNYVSSISVNGQPITGVGTNLNLVAGNGLNLTWVSDQSTLTLSNTGASGATTLAHNGSSDYWGQTGNNSTNPDTNYVGTSDSVALEIHVNNNGDSLDGNGRVMRYEPMQSSADIIGGNRKNYLTAVDSGGDVIAGGGNYAHPNWIAGNYGTVSGGYGNAAYSGGVVGGGTSNFANITATVAGGTSNAAALGGTVGGGIANITYEEYTTISGGWSNTINPSAIGPFNPPGLYSSIGGGNDNNIYGPGSTIPGGGQLNLGSFSFGYNGDSLQVGGSPRVTDLSLVQGIGYFGNVNVMIGNVDSVARQLRFYGPNTSLTYGSSAKYTAFRAPLMDSDVLYTLPNAQGANSTVLTEDGHGNLSWGPGNGTDTTHWSITGNYHTSTPTNFLGTLDSNSLELHIFDTGSSSYGDKRVMRYEINDTSANIIGGYHDNALIGTHIVGVVIAGGGADGHLNIAKGSYAVIAGGRENTDTLFATVGGGDSNRAMGIYSSVASGLNNIAAGPYTSVGGGSGNLSNGDHSVVAGGQGNIDTSFAFAGGGNSNQAMGLYSVVTGGSNNIASGDSSAIGGGSSNMAVGINAVIAGGQGNKDTTLAFVGSGDSNSAMGLNSVAVGGKDNFNQAPSAVIVGGTSNAIFVPSASHPSTNSFIGAGEGNTIKGDITQPNSAGDAAIVAGTNNYVSDSESFIGAGNHNLITEQDDFILAGYGNSVNSGSEGGSSGIGAGQDNMINASQSMVGAGDQNIIDTASSGSFLGAGGSNYINSQNSFIGSGSFNKNLGLNAAMGAGNDNIIDTNGSFATIVAGSGNVLNAASSFIGTGTNDTAMALGSFLGAGDGNAADLVSGAGNFASIPAGEGLETQSYAQTALGFFNKPAGSTINDTNSYLAGHIDDPLIIVGNGKRDSVGGPPFFTHFPRCSDAWTLANAGYSSAYDSIGSGGAEGVPGAPTRTGSTYEDNTIIAAGNVIGGATNTVWDVGVGVVKLVAADTLYTVQLNVQSPGSGTVLHTFQAGEGAITTSIGLSAAGNPGFIATSGLLTSTFTFTPQQPGFTVITFDMTGHRSSGYPFQFHVVAK